MILKFRVAAPLVAYPLAALPNACMSLEALWSKHSLRLVQSSAKTNEELPAVLPARNTRQVPALRESRKRPAVPDAPQQNQAPKKTSNSFPNGITDLGSRSLVIFQPQAFNQSDSQRLCKALKVCQYSRQQHHSSASHIQQHVLLGNTG